MLHRSLLAACGLSLAVAPAALAQRAAGDEGALPRYMTPAERAYALTHPAQITDAPTPPPTGPVHCAAEYVPMDGLVMAYRGAASWNAILVDMTKRVTAGGHGKVYMAYDPAVTAQATIQSALVAAGANMSLVQFVPAPLNSIWCRDYGPRYIYQGGNVRAISDHLYNRPSRPLDNNFPWVFAGVKNHAIYEMQLNHGGGNYHLDNLGSGYATKLIYNENNPPYTVWSYTEQMIKDIWQSYIGLDTHLFDPYPTSVDATQHIDMWMQIIADDKVIISDWPNNPGSVQDVICDNAAVLMAARNYTVYRVPAFSISGTHYTYTNMVMCNNLVMIPSYTHASVSPFNAQALAVVQGALPGKTVVDVPCQNIISAAGAIHCIVMHVPKHAGAPGPFGGLAPTAYLVNLNGSEALTAGADQEIRWVSDDDEGTINVDLRLSVDGGATFPYVIASATPDDRSFMWVVPNLNTTQARVRVVARDQPGNTGGDESDGNFSITGNACYADCNSDGVKNLADFGCFQNKFALGDPYADCNTDGLFNLADFGCFQNKFALPCP